MSDRDRKLRLSAITTLVACGLLVVIGRSEPKASYLDPGLAFYQRMIRMAHDRNLNKNATDADIAGYYEGLLAGKPVNLLGRSLESAEYRFRGDFLYYEARPHLDIADYDDATLRHVTNSHGMPDVEYSQARLPRTRRLALIGDSITRGQGAPFGANFEALLERHLNELYRGEDVDQFELLNFSNTGYRVTQLVDLALEKVPAFKPDVYVLCLTQLAVNRKWGDHVAQLVWDQIDLKYDFLRELAQTANLDLRDAPGTMDAKLATHRLPALRWAIATMRAQAREQGAEFLVVLVPAVNSSTAIEESFAGLREILAELDVPTVDLLDTFRDVEELGELRVHEGDAHPNEAGHRRIFEALKRRIDTDPHIAGVVLGKSAHERRISAEGY
ncbi:MAG TPA: SGNH/GDSL hydrolase family protein [Vicinamibacterales bacterium]|nr:SGNH/GDSL hydrolase family protein [Vicinamibacterales bacterium]